MDKLTNIATDDVVCDVCERKDARDYTHGNLQTKSLFAKQIQAKHRSEQNFARNKGQQELAHSSQNKSSKALEENQKCTEIANTFEAHTGRALEKQTDTAHSDASHPHEESTSHRDEDDEDWVGTISIHRDGTVRTGATTEANSQLAQKGDVIFLEGMFTSESWSYSETFSAKDVGLFIQSSLNNHRVFSFNLILKVLRHPSLWQKRALYSSLIKYFVKCGLQEAILYSLQSKSLKCACSAAHLMSELVLPSNLLEFIHYGNLFNTCISISRLHQIDITESSNHWHNVLSSLNVNYKSDILDGLLKKCKLESVRTLAERDDDAIKSTYVKLALARVLFNVESQENLSDHLQPFLTASFDSPNWAFKSDCLLLLSNMYLKQSPLDLAWLNSVLSNLAGCLLRQTSLDNEFEPIALSYVYQIYGILLQTDKCHLINVPKHLLQIPFREIESLKSALPPTSNKFPIGAHAFNLLSHAVKSKECNMDEAICAEMYDEGLRVLTSLLCCPKQGQPMNDSTLGYVVAVLEGLRFYLCYTKSKKDLFEEYPVNISAWFESLMKVVLEVYGSFIYQRADQGTIVQEALVEGLESSSIPGNIWQLIFCDFLNLYFRISDVFHAANDSLVHAKLLLEKHSQRKYVVIGDYAVENPFDWMLSILELNHYYLIDITTSIYLNCEKRFKCHESVLVWDCVCDLVTKSTLWPFEDKSWFARKAFHPHFLDAMSEDSFEDILVLFQEMKLLEKFRQTISSTISFFHHHNWQAELSTSIPAWDCSSSFFDIDWMFTRNVHYDKPMLYMARILFLIFIENHHSKYLAGLPMTMKFNVILQKVYCEDNTYFQEEAVRLALPFISAFYVMGIVNENSEADILQEKLYLGLSPKIVDQYLSHSYGDELFGFNASFAFCSLQSQEDQLSVWKTILDNEGLSLFPSVALYSHCTKLFFSAPSRIEMVEVCLQALQCSSIKAGIRKQGIAAFLAIHNVSEFCFQKQSQTAFAEHSKEKQITDIVSKQTMLIYKILYSCDKEIIYLLLKYSFEEGCPEIKDNFVQKLTFCKLLLKDDIHSIQFVDGIVNKNKF